MAISRKRALKRMRGIEETLLAHLDTHIPATIGIAPTAAAYWRTEVGGFLDEMERLCQFVGKKTSDIWRSRIAEYRSRLDDLLGEE